jgi:hypothetical protein
MARTYSGELRLECPPWLKSEKQNLAKLSRWLCARNVEGLHFKLPCHNEC